MSAREERGARQARTQVDRAELAAARRRRIARRERQEEAETEAWAAAAEHRVAVREETRRVLRGVEKFLHDNPEEG